jgi:hypothetical protein
MGRSIIDVDIDFVLEFVARSLGWATVVLDDAHNSEAR